MDIKLIEIFDDSIKFILTESKIAFANAIRRIVLANVPTLVIEDVYVLKNTSPLFDEFIAQRLGLVPLKYNEDFELNFRDKCECGGIGCNLCTVTLTISKETTDTPTTIYSGDLISSQESVEPINRNIPIVKLGPNQSVELECMAQLGTGKDHAKWQPVSAIGYQLVPLVEIDQSKCTNCNECITSCYRDVFDEVSRTIKVVNSLNCNLCKYCVEMCEEGAISISEDPSQIIISFDINTGAPASSILVKAGELLLAKTDEFKNVLQKAIIEKEEKEKNKE